MEAIKYMYELYEALPRCGPGDNRSTRRAFKSIPKPPMQPLLLDIGCGPGVQTIELARISNAKIVALDNHQPFLDKLMQTAGAAGLAEKIVPKNMSMQDMDFEDNAFDIIWSEGALYLMGFENGLRRCHQLLKSDGYLAVTEIVYLVATPPEPVIQYFDKEYPNMMTVKKNIELIENEGFNLISSFTLPESSWLENYYQPIEEELLLLYEKYRDNEMALGVFKEMKKEVNFYKKYSEFYGYAFFVMQRND